MRPERSAVSVCIVQPTVGTISETFIRAHAECLPASVTVIHGSMPHIDGQPIVGQSIPQRLVRKCWRLLRGKSYASDVTEAFVKAFRLARATIVLAEFGPVGAHVREACRQSRIPLVVHFHGYDASRRNILAEYEEPYRMLFQDAAGVVVVSEPMRRRLEALGAPPHKIYYNPYGVDCRLFYGGDPATSGPILLAVGRFVEKKAPQITISAFAIVQREYPEAQLRMIGDGPLLEPCRDLVSKLGLENAVHFLGAQPPEVVTSEMRQARAFVQHSVEASDGDSEGLPNSILEAGATGLPVVATRHAGIPEAVLHGETGLLVEEGDVQAMAVGMHTLLRDSELADRLGKNARQRISTHFSRDRSIAGLWSILSVCAALPDADRYRPVGIST